MPSVPWVPLQQFTVEEQAVIRKLVTPDEGEGINLADLVAKMALKLVQIDRILQNMVILP